MVGPTYTRCRAQESLFRFKRLFSLCPSFIQVMGSFLGRIVYFFKSQILGRGSELLGGETRQNHVAALAAARVLLLTKNVG